VPADDRVRFRLRLIAEEFFETMRAAFLTSEDGFFDAEARTLAAIESEMVAVDLPEFVDGMADLDYVVEGTRLEFGVDSEPIADEVQRANMSKGFNKNAAGKTVKPEGWTPPDIAGRLADQGWVKP